jgi:anti-sigma-K factor RskA
MDDAIHELTAGYALDALDAEERAAFEAHLGSCPRCRDELASFWRTAGALAYAAAGPAPSPELRGRLLARARAERPNVVPLRPRAWALPAVGAVAAVAAVAALALGLWASSLSGDLDQARSALADQRLVSSLLADDASRSVALRGASGRLVVGGGGRAALVVRDLSPAPAGKAYEIWVIAGQQAPRPAGLFDENGAVALEGTVPVDATVAVTLEDDDGADAPSGTPLFSARV